MVTAQRKIPIAAPLTGQEEWEALKEPVFSGWLTQGPKVAEFERLFAERHGVKHAIAVSNCTAALHLALLAIGVREGDEVIVPAFTWVATANSVLYCNATLVFADIDISTFNINPDEIAKKITKKTKAIIPVHLFGLCADIEAIKKIAPGIPIVEDGACAAGAALNNKPAGSLGDIGCFSFHPRKSITTGEGGMITTNNDKYADTINKLRNHGASISEESRHHGPKPYILPAFDMVGYNYRMTDLQGAVGIVQLKKLDRFIEERQKFAEIYTGELPSVPWLSVPSVPSGYRHGWQSYVCMVDETKSPKSRNEIMEFLEQKGISTRPGTHAVHMLGYYAGKYKLKPLDFPNSFKANEYSIALPLHNNMVHEDFKHVAQSLIKLV
ncbi:MAG: DegT/DnrJ/EryC1/StrS family aminotransferase [Bacteroidetes bacterium]|nr:DegT/DnrJ/EryC1/StrS family aminotransferase [Bacteroidota bacterium]